MQYPLLSLSASAGSGKTYQLTRRYLDLLLQGAKPANILALTFTKKAAKEMEDRIILFIEELYHNKSNRDYISKIESINIKNEQEWKDLEAKIDTLYHEVLHQDLKIITIDAFFQKILKSFCWYANVEYDFKLQEENLDAICELFLGQLQDDTFQAMLDICFLERENLDSLLKLCIFLDTFKESLHPSLFKSLAPSSINYKANVMQYATLIKNTYYDTFGKIANCLQFNDFKSLLEKGKTWLTKARLQEYSREGFSKVPFQQEDFESLKENIAAAFLQDESLYLRTLYEIFQCFLSAKEEYYKQSHSLSFNAVSSKVYQLLKENLIHKDFLYFRLDSTLSHILIDEFQDTSILQYAILKPLIDEIKSGIGQRDFFRSFFYVGDVKQSIYRFRGGKPELFKLASEGMQQLHLEFNYRSAICIVEFVNHTFKNVIENFIPQIPNSKNEGFVCIKSCLKENFHTEVLKPLKTLKDFNVKDEEIAILVFDNKTALAIAQLLQEQNFRVVIDASFKLIHHNEVRAILELLKYLHTKNVLFKKSFFMLLGLKEEEDSTFELFLEVLHSIQSPAHLVLKIMERYKIASLSAKKFLEASLEYPTLLDLLEVGENLPLDIVSSDISGIRIMTIHKSKGLEFKHVLILDKINKGNNQHSKVFFTYKDDGIEIAKIFQYSNTIRQSLDRDYYNAIVKEKQQEEKDLMHLLYVALTRAKNTMFILTLNEQSAFTNLQLTEATYGNLENALQESSQDFNIAKNTEFCEILKEKASLENQGRQQNIQTKDNENIEVNLKGVQYGIALHFAMELAMQHHLSDVLLLEILNNKFGFYFHLRELEKIILHSKLALKNEDFIEIIAKGSVKCEVSFLSNGRQKRLDLLILGQDAAWIVDYKTGVPDVSHAQQVREYMEFVGGMLKKKTYGYLFYTHSKEEQEGQLIKVE